MTVARIKCTDCDNMILPETAVANGGLCGQCAKTPESIRRARREFDHKLASGLVFSPSQEERTSAKRLAEFGSAAKTWMLEPEYYKQTEPQSVPDVVVHASTQSGGYVFLISNSGARLNLAFNEEFGVCEYQNEESGVCLYAYTSENLCGQVSKDQHLVQACPCCGVGMLWFPSRFHMPRRNAFDVYSALVLGAANNAPSVEWLDGGDISDTAPGRG
jgi:hypothetical protein